MPSIELTDDQHERFAALCEELAETHAGAYASVSAADGVRYLLDLAANVDDPDRRGEVEPAPTDGADASRAFPRAALERRLRERNRRNGDDDGAAPMDLYAIATEYGITGRSEMTKSELIDAILETTAQLYVDPFARVDVDFPEAAAETEAATETEADSAVDRPVGESADRAGDGTPTETDATDESETIDESDAETESTGGSQLDAMLSLLDTHEDKWWPADGDARYEVELPDGSVESARTKDDVRAALFRHY